MFYYAQINSDYKVTAVYALSEQSTNTDYIAITQEQYENGDLVDKYYNKLTDTFETIYDYMGASTSVAHKDTQMMLSTLIDNMRVELDEKAKSDELAEVATSGDYNDLENKPTIPEAYTHPETHPASMITGLATVATSGDYNDLTNKPTIPTVPSTLPANGGNADTVDGKHATDFATATHNHDEDYADKTHTHAQSEITGLETALEGKASATHNHDTAYAEKTHTHAQSEITGLETALSGKANTSHTHDNYATTTNLSELSETVGGKANASHTHAQSEITGLASALNGKANASHTHENYVTTETFGTLEDEVEGKANASHTHAQSEITGLTSALAGKASATHTHDDYATKTEVNTLSSTVAGKANASHTHTLDNVTDTTSYVKMTPAERTKLQGIATGANATTVDSALSSTSTNPVQNKAVQAALAGKAASSHTHDDIYYTETEVDTKLSAKSDTTHTHTASDVGAAAASHTHDDRYFTETEVTNLLANKAASSHTHTAEAILAMASALFSTNSGGGVKYSYGSGSGKNLLTEISNMAQGFHTIYSIAGTAGNPETSESFRCFVHKTSTTIGWILAFGADGSIYSNYLAGANTFKGWRTIHDVKRTPLWSGTRYMTAGHTVTPTKKLSQCEHGWMLLWSDYDPDTGTINNTDFCTTMIPNRNWTGGTWNGAAFYCDCPRYSAGTATDSESRVIKILYVYDNKLVGNENNNAAPRNDVVLRAVYEF